MSSEIEVVDEVQTGDRESAAVAANSVGGGSNGVDEDSLRNDVYTAAAYGDLEKLHRLVESEGCSVSEPDGAGYYALQWAALNNRTAAALYIIEVHCLCSCSLCSLLSLLNYFCFLRLLSFCAFGCFGELRFLISACNF